VPMPGGRKPKGTGRKVNGVVEKAC
jgi:hypothetical protein